MVPSGVPLSAITSCALQAIIASTETAANPGACFYFDVPSVLLHNKPTAADVRQLVATHVRTRPTHTPYLPQWHSTHAKSCFGLEDSANK